MFLITSTSAVAVMIKTLKKQNKKEKKTLLYK